MSHYNYNLQFSRTYLKWLIVKSYYNNIVIRPSTPYAGECILYIKYSHIMVFWHILFVRRLSRCCWTPTASVTGCQGVVQWRRVGTVCRTSGKSAKLWCESTERPAASRPRGLWLLSAVVIRKGLLANGRQDDWGSGLGRPGQRRRGRRTRRSRRSPSSSTWNSHLTTATGTLAPGRWARTAVPVTGLPMVSLG